MILAALVCSTILVDPEISSLDNAFTVSLGIAGLNKNTAAFEPVTLTYYQDGRFPNPITQSLLSNVWQTPGTTAIIQRDAILSFGQPHKLMATMSRLGPFGSRRDLLGDPSARYLADNPSGLSLGTVIEKYRQRGLIKTEPTSQGLVPDDLKRAMAILLDAALTVRPNYDASFPVPAETSRLKDLTKRAAYQGGNPQSFSNWLNLATKTDLHYLGAAAQDLTAVASAVRAIALQAESIGQFDWRMSTEWGDVIIQDSRNQTTSLKSTFILIDGGGNDTYLNGTENWCQIILDRSGNDAYLSGAGYAGKPIREAESRKSLTTESGPGRAYFGINILIDESGDDLYRSASPSFGSATFGFSYSLDAAGKDRYDTYTNSLGFALFGVGIHEDWSGDDTYETFNQSQGCGMTAGVGLLIDRAGNDTYLAEDKILDFPSPQTPSHNVSMSQGAGYGLRFDYLFGQSLAGGFGGLFDLKGDDSYSSAVFGQGTGYWMGFGMLWDREGADEYHSVWYGQGSAAHFAIGYLVDDEGNDQYSGLIRQNQGVGHDFSFGLFLDRFGDDIYSIAGQSGGTGTANGFGIALDLAGNDKYQSTGSDSFGFAAESQEGSLRKLALTLGIFADYQGNDHYTGDPTLRNGTKKRTGANGTGASGVFWDQ